MTLSFSVCFVTDNWLNDLASAPGNDGIFSLTHRVQKTSGPGQFPSQRFGLPGIRRLLGEFDYSQRNYCNAFDNA
jgi:hypothetical protein